MRHAATEYSSNGQDLGCFGNTKVQWSAKEEGLLWTGFLSTSQVSTVHSSTFWCWPQTRRIVQYKLGSQTLPLFQWHPPTTHTTHHTHYTRTHNTTQTHTHADEGANTSNVSVQCAPPNSLLWTCSNTDRPLLGRTICRASFSARVPSSSSSPPSECPPAARLACCWKGCASETCWRSCI